MKAAGFLLFTVGVLALLLWGQHLYEKHRSMEDCEVADRVSLVERLFLGNGFQPKAANREYFIQMEQRGRTAWLWATWILPIAGSFATVAGTVLIITRGRSRSRGMADEAWPI